MERGKMLGGAAQRGRKTFNEVCKEGGWQLKGGYTTKI